MGRTLPDERATEPREEITTVTAGLRTSGITAPWLLDGVMNKQAFPAYVADVLAPMLQPGDTVVMDNLPTHKASGIREKIEAVGAWLLYLPAYSPDFNPIEWAFAELRALLGSAVARTIPILWDAIRRSLDRFAPAECRMAAVGVSDLSFTQRQALQAAVQHGDDGSAPSDEPSWLYDPQLPVELQRLGFEITQFPRKVTEPALAHAIESKVGAA